MRGREKLREVWTSKKATDLDGDRLLLARSAGYEPGPDGYMAGRDPRQMSRDEFAVIGHEPMSPMQAIRAKCLDCAGSPHEVRLCTAMSCPCWPFRTGANPWRAAKTEAQLKAARQVIQARRLRQSGTAADVSATTL